MTKEKAEHRGYTILAFIVVLFTVIAGGFKFKTWITNGTYEIVTGNHLVVSYVRDNKDPITTFTVTASGHKNDLITSYPIYVPKNGQNVALFRIQFATKTKFGPYYSVVIPKIITISKYRGKLSFAIDESGRSEWMGIVRNSPTHRFLIPVDKNTPRYFTISLGVLPESGDIVSFFYVETVLTKKDFFNLAILY